MLGSELCNAERGSSNNRYPHRGYCFCHSRERALLSGAGAVITVEVKEQPQALRLFYYSRHCQHNAVPCSDMKGGLTIYSKSGVVVHDNTMLLSSTPVRYGALASSSSQLCCLYLKGHYEPALMCMLVTRKLSTAAPDKVREESVATRR